jgi:hypothetical protein
MKKFNSQAETHSNQAGALRTPSPTHAETHSEPGEAPRTSRSVRGVAKLQHLFFFFIYV